MNPVALELSNFRRWRDLTIDFEDGCTALIGPSGAGKSSLLLALEIALFGDRHLREYVTHGETSMSVLFTFEHNDETYRIRRAWKTGKPTVDLELLADGTWQTQTRENITATDDAIRALIGITRETLRASAVSMQNDGSAFAAAKPAERKRLLCDALGLDIWARFQGRAREELRAADKDLAVAQAAAERLTGEVQGRAQLEHDLAETRQALVEEEALLADAEADLTEISARYQAARDQAGQRATLDAQLSAARADLERLQRADGAATEAVTQIRVARDELETLPTSASTDELVQRERDLLAAIAEHERLAAEYRAAVDGRAQDEQLRDRCVRTAADAEARAAATRARIDVVRDERDATCDVCGQTLGAAKARVIEKLERELAQQLADAAKLRADADSVAIRDLPAPPASDTALAEAKADLAGVRDKLDRVQQQAQQRARLEERITQLQATVAARPAQDTLDTAARACLTIGAELDALPVVDLAAVETEGRAARAKVEQHRAAAGRVREQLARLTERLDLIANQQAELDAVQATIADVQQRIDLLKRAEKMYGPAGLPALILENAAIPQIETQANRIMRALGWTYTLRLDTQRELKSGDGLRESLDIVVETDLGEQTWERCSGGEQQRVNLALRLAIAELVAARRGVEVRLLAIDEPDGLDADGFQALVDLLHDLEARGVFQKILVVSHHPELRTAFEQVLEVSGGGKTGEPSRLATDRVAVPA